MADAVGLVDHHQADRTVGEDVSQRLAQCLGRDVQQLQLAAPQLPEHPRALGLVETRIEERGFESQALEGIHLVLHQRDERRQHQHRSAEQLGGNLERERFAGAGGHQADAVATGEHRVDDLALARAERLVAEKRLQHLLGIGTRG